MNSKVKSLLVLEVKWHMAVNKNGDSRFIDGANTSMIE
jgi:hypothetical protein